jgi:hypothetical protein
MPASNDTMREIAKALRATISRPISFRRFIILGPGDRHDGLAARSASRHPNASVRSSRTTAAPLAELCGVQCTMERCRPRLDPARRLARCGTLADCPK